MLLVPLVFSPWTAFYIFEEVVFHGEVFCCHGINMVHVNIYIMRGADLRSVKPQQPAALAPTFKWEIFSDKLRYPLCYKYSLQPRALSKN